MIDALIVGCGAGGAAAAWRLARTGAKVLVLEAGPPFDPETDYGLDRPGWEARTKPEKPGSQWSYSMAELPKADPAGADLKSWNRQLGALVPGPTRVVAEYAHMAGVGGSTLRYTGEAHRMHPGAMAMKSRFGVAADWPVGYDELEPYYVEVERAVGVSGPADPGIRRRSAGYPLPPHTPSFASQALGKGFAARGLGWTANPLASLSEPYDGRPPCNRCAGCLRGCPIGDKGSADVTFVRQGLATGNMGVLTGSQVVNLEAGPDDRIRRVLFVDADGKLRAAEARVVILAGGAVQTPKLLLASADDRFSPDGLANESGQVGRNFMETVFWASTGLHPDNLGSHRGHPSDSICWDFNAPDALPDTVGGFRLSPGTAEADLVGPMNYAERVVPGWGREHKRRMRETFGHALTLAAIGEHLPNPGSFVDLDPVRRDAIGIPLARIASAHGPEDIARLKAMATTVRDVLAASRVEELIEEVGCWDAFSASHVFGTCRMGDDPDSAVIDPRGRSFRWKNLYIADASVFPSSGGGESPALTIQALALRTADAILAG